MPLLCSLIVFMLLAPSGWAIEVYVKGQKYDSVQKYKVLQENKIEQEQLVGTEKVPSDPSVSLASPAKTIVMPAIDRQEVAGIKKLKRISINPPDSAQVLRNPQSWSNYSPLLVRLIKSEYLENAIKDAVKQSTSAKIIVSDHNSVKILGLNPDGSSPAEIKLE